MTTETNHEIEKGLHFGFIDNGAEALAQYQPELVTNHNSTVLGTIEADLRSAEQFTMAVAFVTLGGLLDLKSTLTDIDKKGVHGRLITSTYLSFNQPAVFDDLLHIPNLDVRIINEDGFHTKAYYFKHADYESILIGSANLTQNALKKNFEWNLRVTSAERGDVVNEVRNGLDDLWNRATPLTADWVKQYRQRWQPTAKVLAQQIAEQPSAATYPGKITPNAMQTDALTALRNLRDTQQAKKALVVAATGTGKTYLAAFDVQQFKAKRVLFVVHREQILRKSLQSFREVLGGPESDYGILSGNRQQLNTRYLFATVNMAAKESIWQQLGADAFDYIIIDEAHRVSQRAAGEKQSMYQRLMNFFKPKFMLGMTATPERTDGTNVYAYFDYHLAYEISLLDALDNNMLTPFHYIGVTDYEKDGQVINDQTSLKHLVSDERVNYIIAKTFYYGPRNDAVHGLIFVSRVEEGRELAAKFNERGISAAFVSATDTIEAREDAVKELTAGKLQYIITVDIFNEGVDIPILNQIVMMRPTKSSIIFLQQLGRGLRKLPNKESVTVLDFIGNYDENYMIPMAFDRSHTSNKEKIRKQIISPSISGVSTIHFEEVARKRVLAAVSKVRLDDMRRFKNDYQSVKEKIGQQAPMLLDIARMGSVDVADVVTKFKTVYDMQQRFEKNYPVEFTQKQYAFLHFLSKEIAVSKRPVEAVVLQQLLKEHTLTDTEIETVLEQQHIFFDGDTLNSVASILDLSYFMARNRKKYGGLPLVVRTEARWELTDEFSQELRNSDFYHFVLDVINSNLWELVHNDFQLAKRFTPGEKYYRADALRMLNWGKEQNPLNVGGYIMRADS